MSNKSVGTLKTMDILRNATNELLYIPNYSFRAAIENSRDFYRIIAECNVPSFYDSFNDIEIAETSLDISPTDHIKGVEITCRTDEPNQFFRIATDFLDFIETNGPNPDISKWCESWKILVGNKYSYNRVYDVLAELLIFSYLQSRGMTPVWSGPDHERHDFRCKEMDCEVKSTVSRSADPIITVQGYGQLETGNKPVRLYVCQLESASNGMFSVKELLNDLKTKGVDRGELSTQFRKTGLNSTRDQNLRFNLLHPIKVYDIDSKFPKVDDKCFKGDKRPDNIINISYTVSLSGIKHKEIEVVVEESGIIFKEREAPESLEQS